MRKRDHTQIRKLAVSIAELRLSLDRNDEARQYLYEAEEALKKCVETLCPAQ